MNKRCYQRSKVLYYSELTPEQRDVADDCNNCDDVQFVLWNNEPICLENFTRLKGSIFQGIYTLSAFSAYLIRLNSDNSEATVVYLHSI